MSDENKIARREVQTRIFNRWMADLEQIGDAQSDAYEHVLRSGARELIDTTITMLEAQAPAGQPIHQDQP
jgi:hypothetical protein